MRQVALIVGFSALACLLFMGAYPSTSGAVSHAIGFETADQSLVVKIKKDKKDDDDDDKPKAKSKPFTCKKAKCDPGEVKLDKPNIYGAGCQAGNESLKPKPAAEKCKFPGEVPPDCNCPKGTEFMGNKGCLPQRPSWWCNATTEPGFSWGQSFVASSEAVARGMFISEMERQKKKTTSKVTCKQ